MVTRRACRVARSVARTVLLVAVVASTVGCGRTASLPLEDMSLAFAVRTALVNDALVGAVPVEIRAAQGVVTLDGRVATEAERMRILEIVRGVSGVRRVEARLALSSPSDGPVTEGAPARPWRSALVPEVTPPPPRYFAAGAAIGLPLMRDDRLDGLTSFGPVFRFGRGAGWRPTMALARLRADLPPVPGTDAFGVLRATVLGGGLGYAMTSERWSLTPSAVVGYSFNHIRLDPGLVVPTATSVPVAAEGTVAVLPSATIWYEAAPRVSVGVTAAYLFCRPQASWLQGERFEHRRLRADAVLVGVSFAYWVF